MSVLELAQEKFSRKLFVKNYNKWYEVHVIFTDLDEANAYMEIHNDIGVIASSGENIVLALLSDSGKINLDKIE